MAILDPNALNPGALSMGGPVPFQVPMQAGGPIDPRRLLAPTQMMPPQRMLPQGMLPQANAPFDMGAMPPEAPQAPPQPSTPFQASGPEPMAPNDSIGSGGGESVESVESGESGTPYSWKDPTVPTGVLGRLKDAGSRIGSGFMQEMSTPSGKKGLRAFGAAMLGAPNFWQGLSKGTTAYDETRDAEEAANKPKTAMVADGAFMASTDRAGNTTFSPNKDIQDYQIGLADTVQRNKLALQDDKQGSAELIASLAENGRNDRLAAADASRRDRQDSQNQNRLLIAAMIASGKTATGRTVKPLAAGLRKIVDKNVDSSFVFDNASNDIEGLIPSIKGLPLDAISRAKYETQLSTGVMVGDNALAYANLKTLREQLRNARLSEFVGVQTEGDANRAMAEIFAGGGSPAYVEQRLTRIRLNMQRASLQAKTRANMVLRDAGHDDLEGNSFTLPDNAYDIKPGNTPAPAAPAKGPPKGYGRIGNSFYAPPLVKAQMLQHKNNPEAIAAFDGRYGKGAAAAFIKQGK